MGNAVFRSLSALKLLDGFSENAQLITSSTSPHMQKLDSVGSEGACLRMHEFVAIRRLFFHFISLILFATGRPVAVNILFIVHKTNKLENHSTDIKVRSEVKMDLLSRVQLGPIRFRVWPEVAYTGSATPIGVWAQSTLGSTAFLPVKYVWKINKMSEFYIILPGKINKISEFYTILPEICPKFT